MVHRHPTAPQGYGTWFIQLHPGASLEAIQARVAELLPADLTDTQRRDALDVVPRQLPQSLSWEGDVLAASAVVWPVGEDAFAEFRSIVLRILDDPECLLATAAPFEEGAA